MSAYVTEFTQDKLKKLEFLQQRIDNLRGIKSMIIDELEQLEVLYAQENALVQLTLFGITNKGETK